MVPLLGVRFRERRQKSPGKIAARCAKRCKDKARLKFQVRGKCRKGCGADRGKKGAAKAISIRQLIGHIGRMRAIRSLWVQPQRYAAQVGRAKSLRLLTKDSRAEARVQVIRLEVLGKTGPPIAEPTDGSTKIVEKTTARMCRETPCRCRAYGRSPTLPPAGPATKGGGPPDRPARNRKNGSKSLFEVGPRFRWRKHLVIGMRHGRRGKHPGGSRKTSPLR